MIEEMEKDLRRLKLVSDRFSKIGSQPKLESHDLVAVVRQVVEYVKCLQKGVPAPTYDKNDMVVLAAAEAAPAAETTETAKP
jgi:hypothetical protein